MKDPTCKRFHRKCDDFSLCVNIGEKGYVIAEHSNERYCVFYYGLYGKGKIGKIFDPNYIIAEEKQIYDVQYLMNDSIAFEAIEDFHLIGFNTLDKSIKWGYQKVTKEIETINLKHKKSILICFDGKLKINDLEMKRYDYAPLNPDVEYKLNIEKDSDVFVFYHL
jgi:hypothetical protein